MNFRARMTWVSHLLKACFYQHHAEMRPALAPLIGADSVVLDVGSHAGQFAKLFARMAPQGHVYAVEPGSYALSILRPALRVNRIRNVTILPFGLGDQPAQLTLALPIKRSGSYGFGLSHMGRTEADAADGRRRVEETVDVTTVDRLFAERGVQRLDFIKADVEGWEMRMLAGADDVLRQFSPALYLEVIRANLARAGDTPEALFAHLAERGYRAHVLGRDFRSFEAVAAPGDGDFFFLTERHLARVLLA